MYVGPLLDNEKSQKYQNWQEGFSLSWLTLRTTSKVKGQGHHVA